jgi:hypothetical protein
MPLTQPQAGHGSLIAFELDPVGSPGVFTNCAQLNGDIMPPGLSRPATVVTAHNNGIDTKVFGVMTREAMTWTVNWLFDHATHSFASGLGKHMTNNTRFGVRFRGPGGTTDTDEWIMSGNLTNIKQSAPVREGARTADITYECSGPMKIEGVIVGADIS